MSNQTYVIPSVGLGAVRSIAIDTAINTSNQSAQLSELPLRQDFPVTLHLSGNQLYVHHDGSPLGRVSSAVKDAYAELVWLIEQGLTPQVSAKRADAHHVFLRLPRPGLCIPANNPPTEAWALLPHGPGIVLDNLPDDLDIDQRSRVHLLVRLRSTHNTTPPVVSAYVGNHLAGIFSEEDSQYLASTIQEHQNHAVIAVARAYLAPKGSSRTLSVFASPTDFNPAKVSPAAPSKVSASSFETTTFLAQQGPINAGDVVDGAEKAASSRKKALLVALLIGVFVLAAIFAIFFR